MKIIRRGIFYFVTFVFGFPLAFFCCGLEGFGILNTPPQNLLEKIAKFTQWIYQIDEKKELEDASPTANEVRRDNE